MQSYDPQTAPDAAQWLALTESERIALVKAYHVKAGVKVPNAELHAALHAVVETQAALGDETPVRRTLARLTRDGMERHEALHAVATTLSAQMSRMAKDRARAGDPTSAYYAALEKLTEKSYRRDFG